MLPAARIVIVLREPVSRAFSAFNFRWMTWLCGKLVWARAECWAAVDSEEAIKKAQVGPFQMRAAIKLWRSCTSAQAGAKASRDGVPNLRCLQQDYIAKLRDKMDTELRALRQCASSSEDSATPAAVDWPGCLQLRSVMLGPKQIHKVMEDSSFIWRSMYAHHLRVWLRLYPPKHLHVTDPSSLLSPSDGPAAMRRLARFAGVAEHGLSTGARDEVITAASPGALEHGLQRGVRENGRKYVLGDRPLPPELTRRVRDWLHPHQCDLAGLLTRHKLLMTDAGDGGAAVLPWLRDELESATAWDYDEGMGAGVCAGVRSVDEWFVGSA